MGNFRQMMQEHLTKWGHKNLPDKIDKRWGWVLKKEYADHNIIVPPNDIDIKKEIIDTIPTKHRHSGFHNMTSSQALTQSIFGALRAYDKLSSLNQLTAECGRPAFGKKSDTWDKHNMTPEYSLANTYREPHPTTIDIWLDNGDRHVAVECKFAENIFGKCEHKNYNCDGNYTYQNRRRYRCALSEKGILYWQYLPHMFHWHADRDQCPCPFKKTYQIARNVLAVNPKKGHVLLVYDNRNPAFHINGNAHKQWEEAVHDCKVEGTLRRISWQKILSAINKEPNMAWLITALEDKYGLVKQNGFI